MKTYGGMDVYIHRFLTSALFGGEWSAACSGRFTLGVRTLGTHWLGPRTDLDDVERRKILPLLGLQPRPSDRQARSKSLLNDDDDDDDDDEYNADDTDHDTFIRQFMFRTYTKVSRWGCCSQYHKHNLL
jgi:hypothetical protein